MRTLIRTIGKTESGGEPLPPVFKAFDLAKIVLRRSEVSMFAGAPGAGKSTLALAIALRTNVPTLYVSADTGAHTMSMRLFSMITGKSQDEAEVALSKDISYAREALAPTNHIKWSFDAAPTLNDIDEEVLAFEELHGENPHLIVLDNLIDITDGGGEEWSGMRSVMKEIKYLARDTNAAILLLHHTSEAFTGNPCPPRASIQGKVSQLPALICTMAQTDEGLLAVAPVKNRYGKARASGDSAAFLSFAPEYMYIADLPER
jgi:ABC-type branched-subunit amino acid transport system ATPase component